MVWCALLQHIQLLCPAVSISTLWTWCDQKLTMLTGSCQLPRCRRLLNPSNFRRFSRKVPFALSSRLHLCRVVVSTEPLEEQTGDIMLPPQVVDFAADALASMGGSYTGEIEFSGGSARAIRRLSRHTSQVSDLPTQNACVWQLQSSQAWVSWQPLIRLPACRRLT